MKDDLVPKWWKGLATCCLCGILWAPSLSATEISPSETGWTNALQFQNVQVQIIPIGFNDGGRMRKDVRDFYVTVWLRNTSEKPIAVPEPGSHASDSVVQVLDTEGKSLLSLGWPIRPSGSNQIQLAANSTRGFCVNAFNQECSFLPKNTLKKGRITVMFLGSKVSFEVVDD